MRTNSTHRIPNKNMGMLTNDILTNFNNVNVFLRTTKVPPSRISIRWRSTKSVMNINHVKLISITAQLFKRFFPLKKWGTHGAPVAAEHTCFVLSSVPGMETKQCFEVFHPSRSIFVSRS